MATNIYGNGTNTATAGANTVVHYYDKAGVKAANAVNVYGQWADRKSMPLNMGKTFKISKFLHIFDRELTDGDFAAKGYLTARNITDVTAGLAATDGSGASLLEGSGATNKRSIKKVTMTTAFSRYGEMIDYTDEAAMFSEDALQVRYREELGKLANQRSEDLIQLDMLATTNVMYAGTAAALAEVGQDAIADGSTDALCKVNYDLIRKASRKLVRNRAEKNTDTVTGSTKIDTRTINKAFYAIVGPEVKYDLESLTRGSTYETEYVYVPMYKYASAANLAEGEVGAMHDVRFIESESAVVYAGAGAVPIQNYVGGLSITGATDLTSATPADRGNFDAFPILFPTKGAFATVGLKGYNKISFNAQSPEKIELTNPFGTNGFFSYTMWYAGIILQEERLLKVLVAATA
jgi:N4-gp56 family major capsid protein